MLVNGFYPAFSLPINLASRSILLVCLSIKSVYVYSPLVSRFIQSFCP